MDRENTVLIDFDGNEEWEFLKGLNSASSIKWCLKKKISNGTQKGFLKKLGRYIKYFSFPFSIFLRRKHYERIIAWQQFYGIVLAFFLSLFRCKKGPEIIILTFIFKDKNGLKGKLYKKFVSKALSYSKLKKVCVLSSNEIALYSNIFPGIKNKLYFCKIGGSMPRTNITPKKGKYFVTAGRSNRDYDFLVDSFKEREEELVIISDTYKRKDISKNITILDNCFGESYERCLAESFAVIVSLRDIPVSSGQLVVLNAFRYHKPVIATKHPGINDYIDDNVNGLLIDKTADSLDKAISILNNCDRYKEFSEKAVTYTQFDYGVNIANLFKNNF